MSGLGIFCNLSYLPIVVLALFGAGFFCCFLLLRSWAKKKAKKLLDCEKDAFIAVASHYLLTPLSVIEGAVSTIQEHETTFNLEQRQEYHAKIHEGAKRLLRIAEQMLTVVRLAHQDLVLNKGVNSLAEVVGSVINRLKIEAVNRNIALRYIYDMNNRYETFFDAKLIGQAVEALVDNAIKFSREHGQVEVYLAESERSYLIEVRDQGIGMSAEQMNLAREKFYRGTPPYQFDYEGIGLGLHVADKITTAHEGQLLIHSQGPNRGTTVQIILPRN